MAHMSWSSRRRTLYASGIILAIVAVSAVPVARLLYHAPTCSDGIQNQGETGVDTGGPCTLLDTATLQPESVLWVRAFPVRASEYAATAYIQNPNKEAGVMSAAYKFSFYDANNVLVAERAGTTAILPGAITPVYAAQIVSGSRVIAHSFFEFTEPLVWVRAHNPTGTLSIAHARAENIALSPSVSADVTDTAVTDLSAVTFVATVFDGAGNALASSQTIVPMLSAGKTQQIVFTWPSPFSYVPARIDVLPVMRPVAE